MTKDPSNIRTYRKGGRQIFSDDLNAFRAATVKVATVGEGFSEDEGLSENTKLVRPTSPVVIEDPAEDIPPFSIFGLRGAGDTQRGPISVRAQQIAANDTSATGSAVTLYTNRNEKITMAEEGWAYPLIPGEREFIVYNGSAIPQIGYPCGVEPGSYIISGEFSGLVCVTKNFTEELDGETYSGVWVTLTQHGTLLGKASTGISPHNTTTNTLGKGKVKVHLRNPSASLVISEALDPKLDGTVGATDYFELDVRNAGGAIALDEPVLLHSVAGVGMLAVPTGGATPWMGWVTQEIPEAEVHGVASKPGTTDTPNVRLQYLAAGATPTLRTFTDILDDSLAQVNIIAYNICKDAIVVGQRIQGDTIYGDYMVNVVCCTTQ